MTRVLIGLYVRLTLFVLTSSFSVAACIAPPTEPYSISYTWPPGALILVNPANFSNTSGVYSAGWNWGDALAVYLPCAEIAFASSGGNASVNVNHTAIPKNGGQTVRGLTHMNQVIFGITNRLSHVDIDIDVGVTAASAITDVLMHEYGHTFGLNDCNGCAIGSTVMVAQVSLPSENSVAGPSSPTSCDAYSVSLKATDYVCKTGCNRPTNCSGSCLPQCDGTCKCSPIVLDTEGSGFRLTTMDGGVPFRLLPNGPRYQMSWTEPGSGNGWLVLDRNHNGTIDDFTELFGNLTPQPNSSTPNGFSALAVFDKTENGGNANGRIDAGDAIYDDLRVWIDDNQNGISEASELHTLPEVGIFLVNLHFQSESLEDKNGNVFRYKAHVVESIKENVCYDVLLQVSASPE